MPRIATFLKISLIAAICGYVFYIVEESKREAEARNSIARTAGFSDANDWDRAKRAGFVTPDTWRVELKRLGDIEERKKAADTAERAKKAYENSLQISACVKAERAVKEILKAPSTAKFDWCTDVRITQDRTRVFVRGNVDAQNSFGAMLRNRYLVSFDHLDGFDDALKALSNPIAILDPPF